MRENSTAHAHVKSGSKTRTASFKLAIATEQLTLPCTDSISSMRISVLPAKSSRTTTKTPTSFPREWPRLGWQARIFVDHGKCGVPIVGLLAKAFADDDTQDRDERRSGSPAE